MLGLEGRALAQTVALETKAAEAIHAATVAERDAALNNLVKQAAVLRYQDLEAQSQRSLNKAVLDIVEKPVQQYLSEYILNNPKAKPEEVKEQLDIILGEYLTIGSASVKDPDPGPTPTPDPKATPQTDDDPMTGWSIRQGR